MEPEIFVPFIFFGFLAAVILVPIIVKERTRRSAHQLISQAMERGQQLEPGLINDLAQSLDQPNARKSLGKGVILLALAGAFVGVSFMHGVDDSDGHNGMLAAALIVGSLGAAYAVLAVIDYMTKKPA